MNNDDLLKELLALRAGQEKLLALVEANGLTPSTADLPGADLGRVYRTQGRAALKDALREQNRQRKADYLKRGLAV